MSDELTLLGDADAAELPKSVRQIIPAGGWDAVFSRKGEVHTSPLVCWALVVETEAGEPGVEGIVSGSGTHFAEELGGFLGYLPPGGDAKAFESAAREYEEMMEGVRARRARGYDSEDDSAEPVN